MPFNYPAISITVIILLLLKSPRIYYIFFNVGIPPFLHHFFPHKHLHQDLLSLALIGRTHLLLCSVTLALFSTLIPALFRSSYYSSPPIFYLSLTALPSLLCFNPLSSTTAPPNFFSCFFTHCFNWIVYTIISMFELARLGSVLLSLLRSAPYFAPLDLLIHLKITYH